jgi:pilus assembly protein CpaD
MSWRIIVMSRVLNKLNKTILPAMLASTMLFLPACVNTKDRNHVTVGAVPESYKTKHPIKVSEEEQHLDINIANGEKDLSIDKRSTIENFMAEYSANGSGTIQISLPFGSKNASSAARLYEEVVDAIGTGRGQIVKTRYKSSSNMSSPIRISYRALTASTDECGKWPEDISNTPENTNYQDFGCSYQKNFAAQLSNPADYLNPQQSGNIDAGQRLEVIKKYQSGS